MSFECQEIKALPLDFKCARPLNTSPIYVDLDFKKAYSSFNKVTNELEGFLGYIIEIKDGVLKLSNEEPRYYSNPI